MTNKLELTWIGKNEQRLSAEPRILLENTDYSYGIIESGVLSNGNPWNGNMIIHGDNLLNCSLPLNFYQKNFIFPNLQ